jgi:hypothetical protein
MITASKISELKWKLDQTEKEIAAVVTEYFSEYPYITQQGPTATIYQIIQDQEWCVRKLAEEERAFKANRRKK